MKSYDWIFSAIENIDEFAYQHDLLRLANAMRLSAEALKVDLEFANDQVSCGSSTPLNLHSKSLH